jgi:5-methylthioadenosine/S-adenosylhomocysteine deaminase
MELVFRSALQASPGSPVRRADLVVRDGRVARPPAGPGALELDGRGTLVVPGLVNAHTHLFQTMARGLLPGVPFAVWHREIIRPLYTALTVDDVRVFTRLGALDALRAGTTAVLNFQAFPGTVEASVAAAEAIAEVGLRGVHVVSGYGQHAPPELLSERRRFVADAETLLARAPAGGRVAFWVGVPTVIHAPDDWLRDLLELAVAHGARLHLHLAESAAEADAAARLLGAREVAYLERLGLLGPGLVVAHAVALDADELARLADRGVAVVHCPVSNLYLRSGVAPVAAMRRLGLAVALGTDGPASNDSLDMLGTMKTAALVSALRAMETDEPVLAPEEILAMATREGARALGLADAGTLAEGALGDVTAVGLAGPATAPVHRPTATLVYACTPADVHTVVVGGEVCWADGAPRRVDAARACAEADAHARDLLGRAGLGRLREPVLG